MDSYVYLRKQCLQWNYLEILPQGHCQGHYHETIYEQPFSNASLEIYSAVLFGLSCLIIIYWNYKIIFLIALPFWF